jgi:hypothetical protein
MTETKNEGLTWKCGNPIGDMKRIMAGYGENNLIAGNYQHRQLFGEIIQQLLPVIDRDQLQKEPCIKA